MIKFRHGLLTCALLLPAMAAFADVSGITMQTMSPMSGNSVEPAEIQFEAGMPFLAQDYEGDEVMIQGLAGALVSKGQTVGVESLISDASDVAMRYDAVNKIVYINAPSANGMMVAVVNLDGKVVYNHKFNGGNAEVDLSTLPASIYMVGCAVENQIVKTQKIIVK